jgi:hypothetical protein
MNGRMFLDKDVGCNTCDGKSVVDYVVCSPEVFRCCSDFEVIGFDSLLSDKHCPVKVEFKQSYDFTKSKPNGSNSVNNIHNIETFSTIKWSKEVKPLFIDCIDENKVQDAIKMLDNFKPNDTKQVLIDKIVSEIGNIFKTSASCNNIMKTINISSNRTRRKLSKKPWFKSNCENSRINFFLS